MNWQVQKWGFLSGFLCRKRVLACSGSGLFNFHLYFALANCLEIVLQIRHFQGDCLRSCSKNIGRIVTIQKIPNLIYNFFNKFWWNFAKKKWQLCDKCDHKKKTSWKPELLKSIDKKVNLFFKIQFPCFIKGFSYSKAKILFLVNIYLKPKNGIRQEK